MAFNKKFFTTGGIVASSPTAAEFDPLQNFETVTYTGNGSTQKITGYIRKGAAFRSGSRIEVSSSSKPNLSTATISFWLRTTSTNTQALIGEGYSSNHWGNLQIYLASNKLNARSGNASNAEDSPWLSTSDVNTGDWVHCVVTISGNTSKIYINGSLEITKTLTVTRAATTNPFTIGQMYANGSLFTSWVNDCQIDQVRIFDKAISSSEVTTLYNEDYASTTKSTTDIFGDGSGVALYELDDSANDTGTYPLGQGDIDSGQSADFNGSSEAYNTSVASNLTGDYSFGFYVKFDSLPTEGGLMGIYTPNTSNGTSLAFANGNLLLNCGNSQTATSIPSSFWEVNKWYHIAVTHDNGGDVKLYVNNVLSKTLTTTSTTIQSGSTLILGRSSRTSSGSYNYVQRLNGQMDEVRIYNDVLTETEVGYLAANDSVNIPTGNLIAHYKLDGNGNDETSNNHNLTWSGTELYSTNAEFPLVQYNGTPTNVNFLGMAFQPDFVWIKNRDASYSHMLYDSIRGAGQDLSSDTSSAEGTVTGLMTSFDTNGFTVVAGGSNRTNFSGEDYVAWCWKAGGTAVSNTDGSITSTVSANQDAGFSIGTYSGNSTAGATIGHGLSSAPELIIVKLRSGLPPKSWTVYHKDLGNTDYLYFNTDRATSAYNFWNNTSPTDSVFSVSSDTNVNSSSGDYVFYAFHSVDGYQKVGSYTGTGSSGNKQTTGFQPRFVMIKTTSTTGSWAIVDGVRPNANYLFADTSAAETSSTFMNLESDGFSFTGATGNDGSVDFIYLAIA